MDEVSLEDFLLKYDLLLIYLKHYILILLIRVVNSFFDNISYIR